MSATSAHDPTPDGADQRLSPDCFHGPV